MRVMLYRHPLASNKLKRVDYSATSEVIEIGILGYGCGGREPRGLPQGSLLSLNPPLLLSPFKLTNQSVYLNSYIEFL